MRKYKIASLVIFCLVITLISAPVKKTSAIDSESGDARNIEEMSKAECDKLMEEFIRAVMNNDVSFVESYADIFEDGTKREIYEYIESNDIGGEGIENLVVDFTYPDNSSTGDTVIMANVKIWYDGYKYNLLYLFELHINAQGDIYGYNTWVY